MKAKPSEWSLRIVEIEQQIGDCRNRLQATREARGRLALPAAISLDGEPQASARAELQRLVEEEREFTERLRDLESALSQAKEQEAANLLEAAHAAARKRAGEIAKATKACLAAAELVDKAMADLAQAITYRDSAIGELRRIAHRSLPAQLGHAHRLQQAAKRAHLDRIMERQIAHRNQCRSILEADGMLIGGFADVDRVAHEILEISS